MKYLKVLFGCKIQCFISLYSFYQTTRTSILSNMWLRNVASEMSLQYMLQSEMGKASAQYSGISKVIGNYMAGCVTFITKTRLYKYIENFTSKNWKFSHIKLWYFFIFLLKT